MEMIFEYHTYTKEQKAKLAVIEFTEYVIIWWDQLCTSRRWNKEPTITTWTQRQGIMRKRFVPSYYYRNLYQKLQTLSQESRSVEDYYMEIRVTMLRTDVQENYEATMARFLNDLWSDIAKRLELQPYAEIGKMVDKAMKIE